MLVNRKVTLYEQAGWTQKRLHLVWLEQHLQKVAGNLSLSLYSSSLICACWRTRTTTAPCNLWLANLQKMSGVGLSTADLHAPGAAGLHYDFPLSL